MVVRGLASTCASESFWGRREGTFGCLPSMKGPGARQLLTAVFLEL